MTKITFVENATYYSRSGEAFTFLYKSGNVTVFADIEGKRSCRNSDGMYRWDDKETNVDIVK